MWNRELGHVGFVVGSEKVLFRHCWLGKSVSAPKRWDLVSEILQEVKLGLVVLFVVVFAILVLMVLGPILAASLT